ncbi:MAG: AbrB/MazE/SpoVT family DNA-binding domain-containing protein [Candidatus Scalindua sp. AMX11]|nr:MAG: AbrB/MazE/SpoVT family DNA-binding domain-containing protein [Candidatus Scalindua sp.]NOG84874.1 AbrB/MazE/SpoVT family DNA-binding domain-containing protein [Planctomycetota bacterium]RZV84943.1 MAG: AbrB/MazE/SpoVT family DNA-binding domain-containing protein [Candidatus Scalindua sp. SCAELEC01]TDE65101.1 MAG: AbrB/MazE/SpoVT family DNA-binding domain-containing protein [Candidatus Scalindua sp. AMX11]
MEKQIRTKNIKLIPIGNSKGIRLPKEIIQKYGFSESVVLEEREEGVLLHRKDGNKLSWEDTFKAMSDEKENWNEFDITLMDGLDDENLDS